jgi:hypothetical protein
VSRSASRACTLQGWKVINCWSVAVLLFQQKRIKTKTKWWVPIRSVIYHFLWSFWACPFKVSTCICWRSAWICSSRPLTSCCSTVAFERSCSASSAACCGIRCWSSCSAFTL